VSTDAVRVRRLTKNYGDVQAVRGIDFDVSEGEIFGVIGPDGAGKTSTFQILGGVMQASSGTAEMFGTPARDARSFVGYLTQIFSLYQDLSVSENIRYIGRLRRVPDTDIDRRGRHYLEMFGMDRFTGRLAGRLSGGMKQKLALACSLVAEPRILLLDEPTTGVDPVSRREFWDTLAQLSVEGMTIVVATPYLDEAERCHRVALMHDGVIIQTGTPTELRSSLGLHRLEVRADDLQRAEAVLDAAEGVHDIQRFGDRLDVMVSDVARGEQTSRQLLQRSGLRVNDIRSSVPTLENTFVSVLRDRMGEQHVPEFPASGGTRAPSGNTAIGARDLGKRYGSFEAVKHVDIAVRYGEIYGLLGANGAGKTTTIKMLCGLIAPTSGRTELAGEKRRVRSRGVRQQIGYMSQKFSLYDDLTVSQNLDYFAGVYCVPVEEREHKKQWVLSFAGLEDNADQVTGSLPGGWKQRVAFGAAIMHEPKVLFLDEPTSGVDPLARRAFWRMINALADRGTAILVTTHYLEEAEQCNRLGFMVAGELVAEGAPSEVKATQMGHLIELHTSAPERAIRYLKQKMDRWRVSLFGSRIHLIVDEDVETALARIKSELHSEGITVDDAAEREFSLEDVFLVVVEKARQQGKIAEEE
jgi:ABC-2 type transport system ATP-binding protein